MVKSFQMRKRQLVRDTIHQAAIELFARRGFDETTVDEVAEAAGISRRSFFRYFQSKDDLLALSIVNNGELICKTVTMCSANLSLIEVVQRAIFAAMSFIESHPETKKIIEISARSRSAGQAQFSRLMEQQEKLAIAFATRVKSASPFSLAPFLMAGLTWTIINSATMSWFEGEHKDIQSAARAAFVTVTRIIQDDTHDLELQVPARNGKRSSLKGRPRNKSRQ